MLRTFANEAEKNVHNPEKFRKNVRFLEKRD